MNSLHEQLNLYISADSFTFEPTYSDPQKTRETLVISRQNTNLTLNAPPPPVPRQEEVITIFGFLGIIKLNAGDHIIVVTDKLKIGSIDGKEIYKLAAFKIIPVSKSRLHLSNQQLADDDKYLHMLEDLLSKGFFYFSYTFDLTNSLQQKSQFRTDDGLYYKKFDERFFWNRHLQSKLIDITSNDIDQNLSNFILPVICGFVEILPSTLNGKAFTFCLISRRSRFRAGTRYNMRGIDAQGNVANFVETEQIVVVHSTRAKMSYLQTRGSMPFFWRQVPNVKYTPKLVIEANALNSDSFRRHFTDQIHRYGKQIVINLINKKGYEKKLGDEFQKYVDFLNDTRIRYVHFDFHHHCRKMRYDKISVLIDEIQNDLASQGYCHLDENDSLMRMQTSVVRTNCMDCLDRTNVVQSVLARIFLTRQLRDVGILEEKQLVEDTGEFERNFKAVWADNADAVSLQYSGTGALKTDFTRTGKRTTQGALNDLSNSCIRYVKNNFFDGWRQDSFDLFVGRYEVVCGVSPYAVGLDVLPILYALLFVFSIFVMMVVLATDHGSSMLGYFYLLLSVLLIVAAGKLILKNGMLFIDNPRLVPHPNINESIKRVESISKRL